MANASARTIPAVPPPNHAGRSDFFARVAGWTIRITGGRWGFLVAFGTVVVWAVTGPIFRYSDDWQLFINTGTSVVTFLMVFLIQNAQNRESKAVQLKLDELILAVNRARNEMIDIESLTEDQLDTLAERYKKVAAANQHKLRECFPPEKGAEATKSAGQSAHITVK
jgi:low affinity Fe/Cu permease